MANLTQEQIMQILSGRRPGEGGTTVGGQYYQPHYSSNASGEAGQGQGGDLQGILNYDPTKTQAGVDQYGMYGADGKYQGQGMFKEAKSTDLALMALLAAVTMGVGLPAMMGAGAAMPGAAGAAGLGAEGLAGLGTIAGDAFMPAALGATGAGLPSTLAGLEAFLAPAVGGAAGAGAATVAGDAFMPGLAAQTGGLTMPYGSVLPGLEGYLAAPGMGAGGAFNAAKDSQLANVGIEAAGGDALGGYSGMAGTTGIQGVPGQSMWDSLVGGAKSAAGALPGGGSGLGGLATSLLGGALGSKGQEGSQTSTNKIDPRMDPYIFGPDGKSGILGNVDALYKQQLAQGGLNDLQRQGMQMQQNWLMSPEYSQGFNQMRNVGSGLLGSGIAANPFKK